MTPGPDRRLRGRARACGGARRRDRRRRCERRRGAVVARRHGRRGPRPEHVSPHAERCAVALMGNHDYGATGAVEPARFGEPGSPARRRSSSRASGCGEGRRRVDALAQARGAPRRRAVLARRAAQRRSHEYVGAVECRRPASPSSAGALGLVGHTHGAAAWRRRRGRARAVRSASASRSTSPTGKWLLNPGAVGAPVPPRRGWWDALDAEPPRARSGCCSTSSGAPRRGGARRTTRRPARARARALGLA